MGPRQAKLLVLATIVALQGHWSKATGTLFVGSPQILRPYGLDCISRRVDFATAIQFANAFNSASRLWDRAQKLLKATENATKDIEVVDERGNTTEQAQKLFNGLSSAFSDSQPVIAGLELEDLPNDTVSATPFQRLMMQVLSGNETGLTSVHAEPGVGKSVATLLALPAGTLSKNQTILLSGAFRRRVLDFTKSIDLDMGLEILEKLLILLHRRHVHINLILDNAFENTYDGNNLIRLAKRAFNTAHHIVVVTQTGAMATEIGDLNGARTRLARQQINVNPARYRWNEEQARKYLEYLLLSKKRTVDEATFDQIIEDSNYPDGDGGWKPVDIMVCLTTGQPPQQPGPTSARQTNAVWVKQLQKDDSNGFKLVGDAFQVKDEDMKNIDDLKEAIKKKMELSIAAPLIDIYSQKAIEKEEKLSIAPSKIVSRQEDGNWSKEEKMSEPLRDNDEATPYGYTVP